MAFVSILGTSSKQGKRVCITSEKLGTFYLDVTTNEQHLAKLRVTDNPIESGSRVSDHAVIDPKEITLTGVVVGYSPPVKLMSAVGKGNVNFEDYPLPVEVKAWASSAQQAVNQVVSEYKNVTSEAQSILSDFVPNIDKTKFDTSSTSDRVSMAYDALLTVQSSGGFVEVLTSSKLYKNMLITSISLTQVNQMSASITLTFKEVFVVATKVGTGLVSYSNLGKTQMEKVDPESVITSTKKLIKG